MPGDAFPRVLEQLARFAKDVIPLLPNDPEVTP
jgi:hypothetical protein